MKILTKWLREYLPELTATDAQLAEDLTLRGIAVEGIFDLGPGNGSLFEMDITTNRVDAMNHYGVAREAATIYGLKLSTIDASLPASKPTKSVFPIRIDAPEACGRFTGRILRGITVGQTTGPAAHLFDLLEQKKISNLVDATNYAWLAMGHPTHAFDLDKLEGGIIVRRAKKGEKLKTLDGIERTLDEEDLIIADEKKPVGLAGVMGGWDTMITPTTKNVLVEAAWFEQTAVRKTARRHGLHTDASHRFERGADFNAPPLASAIVCQIILANGGTIEGELIDVKSAALEARTANRVPITLALTEVHRILGITIDPAGISATEVESILTSLGCHLNASKSNASTHQSWQVTLPSWRLDLEREIDLVEEVARVYGYNRFANTLPASGASLRALPWASHEVAIRTTLLAAGLNEAISSTFCALAEAELVAPQPGLIIPLGNPLSEEAGVMRPSLIPGMLTMIAGNLHRDSSNVRLFELGTVFSGSSGSPDKVEERPALSFGLAGQIPEQGALHPKRAVDFHDLKGIVELLLARFQFKSIYFDSFPAEAGITPAWLHPYRSARIVVDGLSLGWFGELHPTLAFARKLKDRVLVGEIHLDRLYKLPLRKPHAKELSRFQPVRRDFSLIVPASTQWASLDNSIAALHLPELIDWQARELFRDPKLKNEYSLLVGVTFQAQDRTLREEELQSYSAQVVQALATAGAKLRS
jgi:phenylalanyl-tRNA synthetase beta chain